MIFFYYLESLQLWRSRGRSCIWIKVPIDKSIFIASAAQFGFEFHHAEHQKSLLKLWLNTSVEYKTPRFATHQIGVSGSLFYLLACCNVAGQI